MDLAVAGCLGSLVIKGNLEKVEGEPAAHQKPQSLPEQTTNSIGKHLKLLPESLAQRPRGLSQAF